MISGILLLLAVVLGLFIAGGMVWQALDTEEFPDSELPKWFVTLFRNRHTTENK